MRFIPLLLSGVKFWFCEVTIRNFELHKIKGCLYQPETSDVTLFCWYFCHPSASTLLYCHEMSNDFTLSLVVYRHTGAISYHLSVWIDWMPFTQAGISQTTLQHWIRSLYFECQFYFIWLLFVSRFIYIVNCFIGTW